MNDNKYSEEDLKKIAELEQIYPGADLIGAMESLAKSMEPVIEKTKNVVNYFNDITLAQDAPDPSRRRFEAVATKRRRKCKRKI